jgi:hypothetical protein
MLEVRHFLTGNSFMGILDIWEGTRPNDYIAPKLPHDFLWCSSELPTYHQYKSFYHHARNYFPWAPIPRPDARLQSSGPCGVRGLQIGIFVATTIIIVFCGSLLRCLSSKLRGLDDHDFSKWFCQCLKKVKFFCPYIRSQRPVFQLID